MGLERKAGAKSCRNNQAMYRIQIRAMGSRGGLYAASAINRIMIYKDFSDFCKITWGVTEAERPVRRLQTH